MSRNHVVGIIWSISSAVYCRRQVAPSINCFCNKESRLRIRRLSVDENAIVLIIYPGRRRRGARGRWINRKWKKRRKSLLRQECQWVRGKKESRKEEKDKAWEKLFSPSCLLSTGLNLQNFSSKVPKCQQDQNSPSWSWFALKRDLAFPQVRIPFFTAIQCKRRAIGCNGASPVSSLSNQESQNQEQKINF